MHDKHKDMLQFWSDRVRLYGADPKSNTNDVWLREVEIIAIQEALDRYKPTRVLDFGCANGYTTRRLAERYPDIVFVGVDINQDMITAANEMPFLDNLSFQCRNVVTDKQNPDFDLITSVRALQNIDTFELQRTVFDHLHDLLVPNGLFFFIESYVDGYTQINQDRINIGLPPLPIQPHLTLLTEAFDEHVGNIMACLDRGSPSSSYYLITRLAYSKLASVNNETIDYDHPLHRIAALVPQIGEYGPQKSRLFRKGA